MPKSRLDYLFECYVQGNCTVNEQEELMLLINSSENEELIMNLIDEAIERIDCEFGIEDQKAQLILENILKKNRGVIESYSNRNFGFRRWVQVAAILIFFLTGFGYWFFHNDLFFASSSKVEIAPTQILPGGNHGILTMSSGKKIWLDDIRDDSFLLNGIAKVHKLNGLLTYDIDSSKKSIQQVGYNTLTTPKGGEYQVVLVDGTKVWLNSGSSLRFPIAFTGGFRVVELQGEGYFEVPKNKKMPFLVKVGHAEIKVLGTHFNISAYSDESGIDVSLIEGSIQIKNGDSTILLKPGNQASIKNNENQMQVSGPNMEKILAWKNGLFQFEGADITTIMKEICRWYNVDVVYKGKIPDRKFEGKISRSAELSDVLKIMELSNVSFKLNGRQIIVE